MPSIRPSADRINNYNGILTETYERLCGKSELYRLLDEGLEAERSGKVRPFNEAIASIRRGLSQ